jgi:hypothetical protein
MENAQQGELLRLLGFGCPCSGAHRACRFDRERVRIGSANGTTKPSIDVGPIGRVACLATTAPSTRPICR